MLFEPIKLRELEIKNRFVHAPTYEVMADRMGRVSEGLVNRYKRIAAGGTGLIIPGYMYVDPRGKSMPYQTGIHNDDMIPGLKRLVDAVHAEGSKIIFQLHHGGRQTHKSLTGFSPMAPSATIPDPVFMTRGNKMDEYQIEEVINLFGQAARRAIEAGADGVQLHAANGFLINQFLSPFFNRRKDRWGKDSKGRFSFFAEVFKRVKMEIPENLPVIVKLNVNEHLPGGITPELASYYIQEMATLGIDGLEPVEGTISFNNFNIWRGDVPVSEMTSPYPLWKKPFVWMMMKAIRGKYDLSPAYVLNNMDGIKEMLGDIPLFSGGGVRTRGEMDEILDSGKADLISLSRPFIRQPALVRGFKDGSLTEVKCISCNKCVAAVNADIRLGCYAGQGLSFRPVF